MAVKVKKKVTKTKRCVLSRNISDTKYEVKIGDKVIGTHKLKKDAIKQQKAVQKVREFEKINAKNLEKLKEIRKVAKI